MWLKTARGGRLAHQTGVPMRLKSYALCSASMAAMLFAAPAFAQDQQQPATPPDPTVEAQTNPADPTDGSPQTDDAVQTATGADQAAADDQAIVVTGLRRSLQSAQNIKRNSEQQIDAIGSASRASRRRGRHGAGPRPSGFRDDL